MQTIGSLLPLLLTFVLIACLVKLAARLLGRTIVSWKHSFMFNALLALLTIAKFASRPHT